MRVVHAGFSDSHPGASTAAYAIHREMRELGIDSHLVVSQKRTSDPRSHGPTGSWRPRWAKAATRIDLDLRGLLAPLDIELSLNVLGSGMVSKVAELRPDLVQLHWISAGFMRIESLRSLAAYPLVWRLADMWPFTGTEHYTQGSRRFAEGYHHGNTEETRHGLDLNRWAWRRKLRTYRELPDLTVVCPSNWMADMARQSMLLSDRDVRVIHTGVDLEVFRPRDQASAREMLGLPQEQTIALFGAAGGGPAYGRKGFSYLEEALAMVDGRIGAPAHLAVFGTDQEVSGLPLPTTTLGRTSDRERMAEMYAAADVFVAPSVEENLANTVLESLACGTPVVAFRIGGMPDAVEHGVNGYLAEPRDASDLAGGITRVLGQGESERNRMRFEARRTAETKFDHRRQTRRYVELYEELLDRRQPAVDAKV